MDCKYYDNWCEEEKRTCNNCYYERGDNMNIEKAIEILKQEPDFSLNYYNRENAIDVLLTAYEKEKEKNKTLKNLQNDTNRLYIEMIERKNYFEGKSQKLEDKIKAKIEEWKKKYDKLRDCEVFQKAMYTFGIELLQSLLEKEE